MLCPKCTEENNVVKHGMRRNHDGKKQRYYCKNCKKYFVIDRDNSGLFKSYYSKDIIKKVLCLWLEGKPLFKIWHNTGCWAQYSAIHNWIKKYPNIVLELEMELKSQGKRIRKEILEEKRIRRAQEK